MLTIRSLRSFRKGGHRRCNTNRRDVAGQQVIQQCGAHDASSWYGVGAPSRTSTETVALLNAEVNAALADAKFKGKLTALGGSELAGSSADFGKLIASETDKWRKVIRAAHIQLD